MSSRAIVLPAIGDPFLLNLWFTKSYPKFKDEVDKVFVVVDKSVNNGGTDTGIVEAKLYVANKYSTFDGHKIETLYGQIGGIADSISTGYQEAVSKCDYFGIIQEDAFVFKSGEVDRAFKSIESGKYDAVASPMYCYSAPLNDVMRKFSPDEPYLDELGYAFWQNFFFSSGNVMKKTDQNFHVQEWPAGTLIEYLGYIMQETMSVDVMASISFQLRVKKMRIKYVSQSMGADDRSFYPLDVNEWLHVNSLSSIYSYMVNPIPQTVADRNVKIELERRVSWWKLALDIFPKSEIQYIESFYASYRKTVNELIARYNLSTENIEKRQEIILRLFE